LGFLSAVLIVVQLSKRPDSRRADPNTIEIAHIETYCGCAKRMVFDEHTVDDALDGLRSVSIDDSSHVFVEMCVVVVFTRVPCSFKYKCDYVVD